MLFKWNQGAKKTPGIVPAPNGLTAQYKPHHHDGSPSPKSEKKQCKVPSKHTRTNGRCLYKCPSTSHYLLLCCGVGETQKRQMQGIVVQIPSGFTTWVQNLTIHQGPRPKLGEDKHAHQYVRETVRQLVERQTLSMWPSRPPGVS